MADFSSITADSSQAANPPGALVQYVALATSFTANWPTAAQANAGLVTTAPPLSGVIKFAKIIPPVESIDANFNTQGRRGYQGIMHECAWEVAGYTTAILAENQKYLNAGVVCLQQLSDEKWIVLGSVQNPLQVEITGKTGKGGNDERGFTYKASRSNFPWFPPILDNAIVAALTFAA
ncbi:MAG: hypothetical protein Q8K92_19960 [Leadbetterella sp.]|nr:hypothetical protein [Leadbetterella sp.]